MKTWVRKHHQVIAGVLSCFDSDYLEQKSILFGGGTRIAMELNEYRESIDIDFLCPNASSYRAVREVVTSHSLGVLLNEPLELGREIIFDRYGVRTMIMSEGISIKLEFVAMADYEINAMLLPDIPVPIIDHDACFITKLLALSDRGMAFPFKDMVDLLVMRKSWGDIPAGCWQEVERHYGRSVAKDYQQALEDFKGFDVEQRVEIEQTLQMSDGYLTELL
jgi:hypothetical protein